MRERCAASDEERAIFDPIRRAVACCGAATRAVCLLSFAFVLIDSARAGTDPLSTEIAAVRSWGATASKVAEDRSQRRVPRRYAMRTLETARQNIGKQDDTVARKHEVDAARRHAVHAAFDAAQTQIATLRDAVSENDDARSAAAAQALKQALDSMRSGAQ